MAYGAEVYSAQGQLVFDGIDVMYERLTGTCIKQGSWPNRVKGPCQIGEGGGGAGNVEAGYNNQFNGSTDSMFQIVGTAWNSFRAWWNSETHYMSNNIMFDNELAFVKIPAEGILQLQHMGNRLPESNAGSSMLITTLSPTALPYKVFSPTVITGPGNYGMQLFNSAGGLIFDSRKRILGIELFEITPTQAYNILINNHVIDLSLGSSRPNAFVSSPSWVSYASTPYWNGWSAWIKITQPNSSTIRLSRQAYGSSLNAGGIGTYSSYNNMQLMVTRGD